MDVPRWRGFAVLAFSASPLSVIISCRPLGSVGTAGMYLFSAACVSEAPDGTGVEGYIRFVPKLFLPSRVRGFSSLPPQVHLECTRFVERSSRHFEHCETGRPFFLISYSGRSACVQDEERWPFIQASLGRINEEAGSARETGGNHQANFLSLTKTCERYRVRGWWQLLAQAVAAHHVADVVEAERMKSCAS
jgi:hypothetical protein